jgi:hypothetical protein
MSCVNCSCFHCRQSRSNPDQLRGRRYGIDGDDWERRDVWDEEEEGRYHLYGFKESYPKHCFGCGKEVKSTLPQSEEAWRKWPYCDFCSRAPSWRRNPDMPDMDDEFAAHLYGIPSEMLMEMPWLALHHFCKGCGKTTVFRDNICQVCGWDPDLDSE